MPTRRFLPKAPRSRPRRSLSSVAVGPRRLTFHRADENPSALWNRRLVLLRVVAVLVFALVIARLFVLQVLSHGFYAALADDQHSVIAEFFPERGAIYLTDAKAEGGVFPAAVNRPATLVFVNPKEASSAGVVAADAARSLAPLLGGDEAEFAAKFAKHDDPYEVLKRQASDEEAEAARALGVKGVYFVTETYRYYPEATDLSQVTGFLGSDERGQLVGRYGVEGYWNGELTGKPGYLDSSQDPLGRLIGTAERSFRPARDGATLVLTVDHAVQFVVCRELRAAVENNDADGGSVVVLDPRTGAIVAMCSTPGYDANAYSKTGDVALFNNPAIFEAYEPGSIFKPVTMAAAIDDGKVQPNSTYFDDGDVVIGPHVIRNSDGKGHGLVTMTEILEESLNTGTIYAQRLLGPARFREYVAAFGFGTPTGIDLAGEAGGNVSQLDADKDIYAATAAFGQGITATPLQMAVAYAAIANGGRVMRPYVVAERRVGEEVTRTEPEVLRQAVSRRASSLVSSMLVRVVENGHGKRAGVKGYWVAGKTGTAQIPGVGGYEKDANIGSFVGFAPADNPAFVMAVKIVRPRNVEWAETSAAPLFGKIAEYLLKYYQIEPERQ